jgi:hypothetical protein
MFTQPMSPGPKDMLGAHCSYLSPSIRWTAGPLTIALGAGLGPPSSLAPWSGVPPEERWDLALHQLDELKGDLM